jgi:hypothetical protein
MAHPATPPFVIVTFQTVVLPLQIHNHNLNPILSRARNLLSASRCHPAGAIKLCYGGQTGPAGLCEETRARLEYRTLLQPTKFRAWRP